MVQAAPEETNLFKALGDTITDSLQSLFAKITPKEKRYAPYLQYADTITIPASGFAVVNLKGPTRGRFWYVRRLRVSGSNPLGVTQAQDRTFTGTNTATITVPAGAQWTLQSLSFLYTADGVAGNRNIVVTIRDPAGNILYQLGSPINPAAGSTTQFSLAPGITSSANGAPTVVTGPLPAITLQPGSTINVAATSGGDPGDSIAGTLETLGASGRADVFICPDDLRSIASLAQCPITTWRDQLPNIPQINDYGVGELKVGPQEVVNVAITGTVGAVYVASLEAHEWPDIDETTEWVM